MTLGVDTDYFIPPASKSTAKKKIEINPEFKVIGFTGRVAREKDLPTLISAFQNARKKFSDTKLLIVGAGLTEELPKYKNIIYAGSQNNIVPYLQAMDIYVMPSLTETSSLSTMEAMSTGLAVIATPVGMIPEYIINRASGLIFPRGSVEILTEKLTYLLEHDSFRKKLGGNARQTILERYQWKQTVQKINDIMASLC